MHNGHPGPLGQILKDHGVTIVITAITWVFLFGTRSQSQQAAIERIAQIEAALGAVYVRKDVAASDERTLVFKLNEMERKHDVFRSEVLQRMQGIEGELRERRK